MHTRPTVPAKRCLLLKILLWVALILCVPLVLFVVFRGLLKWKIHQEIAAIKQTEAPVTLNDLEALYPPIPPELNVAARLTNAFPLLVLADTNSNLPVVTNAKLPRGATPLPEDTRGQLTALLRSNAPALALVNEALQSSLCRYELEITDGLNTRLPHLPNLRQIAQLLTLQAAISSEAGDSNEAVKSLLATLKVRASLKDEPSLVSYLVAVASGAYACSGVERALNTGTFSQGQLLELQTAFRAAEDSNALSKAIGAERCMFIHLFTRPSDEMVDFALQDETPDHWDRLALKCYDLAGLRDRDFLFYLITTRQLVGASLLPYPDRLDRYLSAHYQFEEKKTNGLFLISGMVLPSLEKVVWRDAELVARLRSAELAFALTRYYEARRELPESLSQIVPDFISGIPEDPFDGKPLRYKQIANGFIVYSVGRDRQDDDGKEKAEEAKPWKRGDPRYDVTFMVER